MQRTRKIKQDHNFIGLLPALFSLVVMILVSIVWGPPIGLKALAAVILIYTGFIFYGWVRTRNFSTMISTIYMLIFGSFLLSLPMEKSVFRHDGINDLSKVLLVLLYIFMIWLIYMLLTKRTKWWGREILELAAQNVEGNEGSFTERPMPTTRIPCTREELEGFAEFFERNLLGLTYSRDKKVIFLPLKFKNEFMALYSVNYNYMEKTWIAVDSDGNVTVNISRKDYLDYEEDLDFDKLCRGLSDLFIDFFELYRADSEVRIIDRLKQVGGSIFA